MQLTQNLAGGVVRHEKQFYLFALLSFVVLAVFAIGADTTFSAASTQVQNWTQGTYGLLVAFGVLATGLAMTIVKHSLMWLVMAVGVALAATLGPGIIASMFTATL